MKTLAEIKRQIAIYGGATFDSKGRDLSLAHGYMVSLADCETIVSLESLNERLLKKYFKLARKKHAYFGLWLDGKELFLDISIKIEDKAAARKIGKHNGQRAIFDLARQESIYLN